MNGRHAAVVLAAGGSRRLGHPKQLLMRDGETLLRRAVRLAGATAPTRVVVVLGTHVEAMAASLVGLDAEGVINARWIQGRSTSLQRAAQALRRHAGPVLILGCDQPALEFEHLQRLLTGAASVASASAATAHGAQLGLPAVIPSTLLQTAHELEGEQGFGHRLSAMPPDTVWRLSAPELQFDIDTPENEQAAIARGLIDAVPPSPRSGGGAEWG